MRATWDLKRKSLKLKVRVLDDTGSPNLYPKLDASEIRYSDAATQSHDIVKPEYSRLVAQRSDTHCSHPRLMTVRQIENPQPQLNHTRVFRG